MPIKQQKILTYFRIVFGLCLFGHVLWAYFPSVLTANFVEPAFHFKFFLFEWIPVPGRFTLYVLFSLALLSTLTLAAGFYTRLSASVLGTCLGWFLLMDSAYFQNHYYFVFLISVLLVLLPSLPVAWQVPLLRFQFAVVYIFGGIAKLNEDWLAGKPMAVALSALVQEDLVPSFLDAPVVVHIFTFGGLLFDLAIVPLLLNRPTRKFGALILGGFHLTNMMLWGLGAFPWLMLLSTLILFCFDEIEPIIEKITETLKMNIGLRDRQNAPMSEVARGASLGIVALWITFQLLIPLRQYLYPGPTRWHQQGDYFAWTMKLNQYNHLTEFEFWNVDTESYEKIPYHDLISPEQIGTLHDPDHILQLAHFLQKSMAEKLNKPIEIMRARAFVSVNGGEFRSLIDQEVNLLTSVRQFGPHPWVLPHQE